MEVIKRPFELSQRYLQAHCHSRTKPSRRPKLCQRACKTNADKQTDEKKYDCPIE